MATRIILFKVQLTALLIHPRHIGNRRFGTVGVAPQHLLRICVMQRHAYGSREQSFGGVEALCLLRQILSFCGGNIGVVKEFIQEDVKHILGKFIGVFALLHKGCKFRSFYAVKQFHLTNLRAQTVLILVALLIVYPTRSRHRFCEIGGPKEAVGRIFQQLYPVRHALAIYKETIRRNFGAQVHFLKQRHQFLRGVTLSERLLLHLRYGNYSILGEVCLHGLLHPTP